MPLFRPAVGPVGFTKLQPRIYRPDTWFNAGYGLQDAQGIVVREADGTIAVSPLSETAAREAHEDADIFAGGHDGYYLTMAEARQALDDGIGIVHYVDDYNDEWSDFYVCDPTSEPFNIPGAPAQAGEPIR